MPVAFLYGQTLTPIELKIKGRYQLITFQLYPFVIGSIFNIDAAEINDACYDLIRASGGEQLTKQLTEGISLNKRVRLITNFLLDIFRSKVDRLDFDIRKAIQIILDSKAKVKVSDLCKTLHLTQRTFERRFIKEVGLTAKQFLQITRFQQSFEQLTVRDFTRLTDIVYENGFADQSHFIRVFKAYTGSTPKAFLKTA